MDTLLHYVQVRAFSRGLRGNHTAWFVVAAAAWMLLRAMRHEDVVYRTRLKVGERLMISTATGPSPPSAS
jgi:hypothetical protein